MIYLYEDEGQQGRRNKIGGSVGPRNEGAIREGKINLIISKMSGTDLKTVGILTLSRPELGIIGAIPITLPEQAKVCMGKARPWNRG